MGSHLIANVNRSFLLEVLSLLVLLQPTKANGS